MLSPQQIVGLLRLIDSDILDRMQHKQLDDLRTQVMRVYNLLVSTDDMNVELAQRFEEEEGEDYYTRLI
jgi:hypothetical protein